jgi:hypothetical protein
VKAPRSCPNSSLSSSSPGIAAELRATKGSAARALALWMERAATSFPLPLSPVIRTGTLLAATRPMVLKTSSSAALLPTSRSPGLLRVPTSRRSSRTSSSSARVRVAFSTRSCASLTPKGLTR